MIVRELVRRCDYDPMNIQRVRNLLDHSNGTSVMKETMSEDDNMVITLWDHYNRTGYLSARILDHIDFDNIGYVDASAIEALLESLPKKPFKVLSIHDCFRCLPSYGNDLRRQYNLQLHLVAKSNLLSDLISQIIHAPVQINKGDHTLADDILLSNYALS